MTITTRTLTLLLTLSTTFCFVDTNAQTDNKKTPESSEIWEPQPRIITPADKSTDAPSDALVLFDGKNLDQWMSSDGGAPKWAV